MLLWGLPGQSMMDRLSDVTGRVKGVQGRIEALADRVCSLRERLRAGTTLVGSLDKLAQGTDKLARPGAHDEVGEDGHMLSDAWEIVLINEEGK